MTVGRLINNWTHCKWTTSLNQRNSWLKNCLQLCTIQLSVDCREVLVIICLHWLTLVMNSHMCQIPLVVDSHPMCEDHFGEELTETCLFLCDCNSLQFQGSIFCPFQLVHCCTASHLVPRWKQYVIANGYASSFTFFLWFLELRPTLVQERMMNCPGACSSLFDFTNSVSIKNTD